MPCAGAHLVTALTSLYDRLRGLVHELAKFGVVGACCFVVDVTVFNVLLGATDKPLTSKAVSTVIAATLSYVGNRHWSFRHRARSGLRREYTLFLVLNGVGMVIALSCLGVSHYVLGFESRLADNIAANGVGLVLGTAFRFLAYRRWVFLAPGPAVVHAVAGGSVAEGPVLDLDGADDDSGSGTDAGSGDESDRRDPVPAA